MGQNERVSVEDYSAHSEYPERNILFSACMDAAPVPLSSAALGLSEDHPKGINREGPEHLHRKAVRL